MKLHYSILLCFLLSLSFSTSAQSIEGPIEQTTLHVLKNGVLVVRIATNKNKVDYFDKVLSNPDLDEKTKLRFQNLKAEAIELRNMNLINIINGFKEYYTFSDYRFVFDSDIKQIGDGVVKGIFISPDTYEIDENISLPQGKTIFYLRAGDYRFGPHPYFITAIITNKDFVDLSGRIFKSKVRFVERFGSFSKKEREVLPFRAKQIPQYFDYKLKQYYAKLSQ